MVNAKSQVYKDVDRWLKGDRQPSPAQETIVFVDFLSSPTTAQCTHSGTQSSWVSVIDGQQLQWPTSLLPKDFPGCSVVILPCTLQPHELRSSKQRGSRAAAQLVQALQAVWQQQWQQKQQHADHHQLVLVGHGFGGHLLKEACLQLQRSAADPALPACQRQQYACTLHSITGLVFYSTPHQPVPRLALPEYEYVLPDMAGVCNGFRALCKQCSWQTLGIGAGGQGVAPGVSVPLSAAAKAMTRFITVPADQHSVARPTSNKHPSYTALQQFLQHLMQESTAWCLPEVDCSTAPCTAAHSPTATSAQTQVSPSSHHPINRSGGIWAKLAAF